MADQHIRAVFEHSEAAQGALRKLQALRVDGQADSTALTATLEEHVKDRALRLIEDAGGSMEQLM
ncbi:hypothetical protein ABEW34_08725 [Paenibacillus algorifonticola]|uniref:Uncharacterized protein n=1 Tax=Paenibacillus sp. BIHB 4019 TaxID=1870819 RepID=A0A1B2DLK7_9BACL|nr:hypothetical protein [Paenibacillus sp. BIHB 4019]ANY68582.1 hypothetical protein BBD42_20460 [Paenibacillus sp. BIHB 4019]